MRDIPEAAALASFHCHAPCDQRGNENDRQTCVEEPGRREAAADAEARRFGEGADLPNYTKRNGRDGAWEMASAERNDSSWHSHSLAKFFLPTARMCSESRTNMRGQKSGHNTHSLTHASFEGTGTAVVTCQRGQPAARRLCFCGLDDTQ